MSNEAFKELREKAIEIILSFKPQDRLDKKAQDEILRLKGDLRKTIILLPEKEREVLELRYFENLNYDQISQRIGKSPKEVYETINNGLELVNKTIKVNLLNTNNSQQNIQPKPQLAKTVNNTPRQIPQQQSSAPAVIAGIVSLTIVIALIWFTWFLFQKVVLNNLPFFSQYANSAFSFVQEKYSDINKSEIKKKIIKFAKKDSNNSASQLRVIKISGSSSLLNLSKKLKSKFVLQHEGFDLKLIPSDSERGINSLLDEEIDIANSSRPLTFSDQNRARKRGLELVESRIAIDALIVVVNKNNPISDLSLNNLQQIFSGQVTSWSSFSAFDEPIIPLVREEGSGTNEFVINRILEGVDFPESIQRKNTSQDIASFISQNNGAIGFLNSTNYPINNKDVKFLKVRSYEGAVSFSPFTGNTLNEKAMRYGDYPLAHYLYLITISGISEDAKEYFDWVSSSEGQKVVKESGLIPVGEEYESE